MTTVTTLSSEEVLAKLTPPGDLRVRKLEVGPRTAVKVHGGVPYLSTGKSLMPFAPDGLDHVLRTSRLPAGELKEAPATVYAPMLTWLLQRQERLAVVEKEGMVSDVIPATRAPVVETERALAVIAKALPEARYQMASLTPDFKADLIAISDSREVVLQPGRHAILPKGGDPFKGGVHVSFSPLGVTAPLVEPYLVRLVCVNGAIHAEYLHQYGKGYGEGDDVWHFFRQGIKDARDAVKGILDKYHHMAEDALDPEHVSRLVEGMIRESKLGPEVANTFRARVMDYPPRTMYDLWNHLTYVSTHLYENVAQRVRAMTRAGAIADAESHQRVCPTCRR